ncbi:DNA cytosine methyltransferase [Kribbella sancticallisti]|uniref:DNA (cytosine-5-)-methyltransferase n=1 Tax=Kribbella sancticallisti TaxID=460087 RepID=A0ABN2CY66_9ACTN
MLSLTDFFCGAGGTTAGALLVPGLVVRLAANHWPLAVDTHNTNHPTTDHDCADLSQVEPRRYPRTDVGWFSPECTNHSQAKGVKRNRDRTPDLFGQTLPDEAAERSRATMWDVVRFAEHHRYAALIVENVVDAAKWVLWPAWRASLESLGYCLHVVYLNSMHAQAGGRPAPQSRDRMYVVAHLTKTRCPDLDRWTRPLAYCGGCDELVPAMQAWKKPDKVWGRYRAQYVWRCPRVACRNQVVEPGWLPAASAIDWTIPGQRIGDKARPLAAKTMQRIGAALDRQARTTAPLVVPMEGRDGKQAAPVTAVLRTQTTRNESALLVPAGGTWNDAATGVLDVMRTRTANESEALVVPLRANNTAKGVGQVFDTFAAAGNHHGLLMPYYGNATARTTDDPHGTFTAHDRYALVMRNNTSTGDGAEMSTPVGESLRTLTTAGHQSLLEYSTPAVDDCLFRMLEPHEIAAGMAFTPGYIVLGNKREKVRQLGNAVTPPAARDLVAAVAEALGHDVGDLTTGRATSETRAA